MAGSKSAPIAQKQSQENVDAQGRDCNQPHKRRKLTTSLPSLQGRQQVLGRGCCKHLWSALENNSCIVCAMIFMANSPLGIFEREVGKQEER